MDDLTLDDYVPPDPEQLRLADGRRIRVLSGSSFQLTDSSGKHKLYGAIEHIEYEPSLINEHRKSQPLRFTK